MAHVGFDYTSKSSKHQVFIPYRSVLRVFSSPDGKEYRIPEYGPAVISGSVVMFQLINGDYLDLGHDTYEQAMSAVKRYIDWVVYVESKV